MPKRTNPQTPKPLGPRIRAARTSKKLSRRRLALAIDVDQQTIYRWEEEGKKPSVDTLCRLAAALGVTPGELLD